MIINKTLTGLQAKIILEKLLKVRKIMQPFGKFINIYLQHINYLFDGLKPAESPTKVLVSLFESKIK